MKIIKKNLTVLKQNLWDFLIWLHWPTSRYQEGKDQADSYAVSRRQSVVRVIISSWHQLDSILKSLRKARHLEFVGFVLCLMLLAEIFRSGNQTYPPAHTCAHLSTEAMHAGSIWAVMNFLSSDWMVEKNIAVIG